MKFTLRNLFFIVFLFSLGNINSQSRTKVNFGSDWEFKKEETNSNWEKITIPHTAKIEPLVVNNQFQGTCWYQKKFKVVHSKNNEILNLF
jgi:beta-galactosidase